MSKIVSIDLGTTNSVVSVNINGERTIIPNDLGSYTTPSIVAFNNKGEKLVGQLAKRQQVTNSKNTFSSFKRLMGHTYEEVKNEKISYKIKPTENGSVVVECPQQNKDFTPEELSGFILGYLKKCAEDYLSETIDKAIITVPAYFNQDQRLATKNAGLIAGFKEIVRIINEPTSAALAYGVDNKTDGYILVYDLGGGTFDVTLLEVSADDELYHVVASSGDSKLGGDDFDNKIVDWVIKEFKKSEGVDLSKDLQALQRIKEAAEKAKCELSSQQSANINIPYISSLDNNPLHLNLELTRTKFENLVSDLIERIKSPVLEVLKNQDKTKIKEVVLVGGSTRMPCAVNLIENLVGIKASKNVNPDLVVAEGGCELAKTIQGESSIVLVDVTPLTLSIEVQGNLAHPLIDKNTTIPTKKTEVFSNYSDLQPNATVHIVQGERPLAKDNKTLGMFNIELTPKPKGQNKIEITYDIDVNSVLSVSAKDLDTQKEQKITISQSSNLDQSEIDRMIKEAEEYAESDKEAKQAILDKNELESLIANMKTISEQSDLKVDQVLIDDVKEAVEVAEKALESNDNVQIKEAKEKLVAASHALTSKMYEQVPQEQVVQEAQTV